MLVAPEISIVRTLSSRVTLRLPERNITVYVSFPTGIMPYFRTYDLHRTGKVLSLPGIVYTSSPCCWVSIGTHRIGSAACASWTKSVAVHRLTVHIYMHIVVCPMHLSLRNAFKIVILLTQQGSPQTDTIESVRTPVTIACTT